jgi:hypothetical protein
MREGSKSDLVRKLDKQSGQGLQVKVYTGNSL